jgi:predicted nucleic acid-binding protein
VRVTLDANILVYAAQRHDHRHAAAAMLVKRAARGDCVQTLQSLGECFNALHRKRLLSASDAQLVLERYADLFAVIAAEQSDLEVATSIVMAHQFQFWDAMLWATARRAGCRLILSEDQQDGRRLEDVMFVNPLNPANAKLLDLALPPLEA